MASNADGALTGSVPLEDMAGASGRLVRPSREPLYHSVIAMVLNTGATSVLGMLFWVLAARRYPAGDVGASSAVISILLLLANVSELNLTSALARFLPVAGDRSTQLVVWCYGIAISLGLLVAGAALPLVRHVGMVGDVLRHGLPGYLWFVGTVSLWCVFALQDTIAVALRGSAWVPLENTCFGLLKIGLLVAFVSVTPKLGIFAAWTVPMAMTILPMNVLIFARLLPAQHRRRGLTEPLSPRRIRDFTGYEYVTCLASTASTTLMPLLVLVSVGAVANGYFYVIWVMTAAVDVALNNVGSSLVAECTRTPERLQQLVAALTRHTLTVLLPAVAALVVAAPMVLSVLGDQYARHDVVLLRCVGVSVIFRVVIVFWMSINRVHRTVGRVFLVQALSTTAVLGVSALALSLDHRVGAVGIAYLLCQGAIAVTVLPDFIRLLRHRVPPRGSGIHDAEAAPSR